MTFCYSFNFSSFTDSGELSLIPLEGTKRYFQFWSVYSPLWPITLLGCLSCFLNYKLLFVYWWDLSCCRISFSWLANILYTEWLFFKAALIFSFLSLVILSFYFILFFCIPCRFEFSYIFSWVPDSITLFIICWVFFGKYLQLWITS